MKSSSPPIERPTSALPEINQPKNMVSIVPAKRQVIVFKMWRTLLEASRKTRTLNQIRSCKKYKTIFVANSTSPIERPVAISPVNSQPKRIVSRVPTILQVKVLAICLFKDGFILYLKGKNNVFSCITEGLFILYFFLNFSFFKKNELLSSLKIKTLVMKKFLVSLAIIATSVAYGQVDYNQWSIGVNAGFHDGAAPKRWGTTRLYQPHHFALRGRYMINNRVGLELSGSYDAFKFNGPNDQSRKTNYVRTSLSGVVNAGDLLKFDSWTKKLGLLVYGGFGLSHMWQNDSIAPNVGSDDPLFNEVDDMANWVFGWRPQFKINENISLNADMAFIFHTRQTYVWDMTQVNNKNGIDGYFLNFSLGATYYFGDKAEHADWTPTIYGGGDINMSKYDMAISEINEKMKDDDKDGVPNYVDAEPDTPEGSYVDSKGQALKDTDGDGVLDMYDACVDKAGPFSGDGCPDSDGDGVADNKDKCPTVAGIWNNSGCPEISEEVKEIMDRALKGVQFETGNAVLKTESYKALDEVVRVMKEHDEYKLLIDGHTDNVGDDADNMKLSMERAQACADYLVSKGVIKDHLIVEAHGETQPKALNDTEAGRALNRRVEFNIVFE